MQQHNVLDVSENYLFLVEDVNGDVATRVQRIQLVRGESLHLLNKLLLSINQALDQLTEERQHFIENGYSSAVFDFAVCL